MGNLTINYWSNLICNYGAAGPIGLLAIQLVKLKVTVNSKGPQAPRVNQWLGPPGLTIVINIGYPEGAAGP